MSTETPDLSGIAGADAGGPSTELEELAETITGDGAQGAAATPATAPTEPPAAAAAPPTVIPSGPPPAPPSELVHSSPSRMVVDTPTVVATGASEAVRHAQSHVRADTPAGPRTRARPIFRRPQAGHTTGETPAGGDTRAMENRMNTAEPPSHVGLGQLAREARGRALALAVGGLGAPERSRPGKRTPKPATRPEGAPRPRPGMSRSSLERFTRRG